MLADNDILVLLALADNDIQVLALADNPSHLLMSLWVDTWTAWGLCRRGTMVGGYGSGWCCILRDL